MASIQARASQSESRNLSCKSCNIPWLKEPWPHYTSEGKITDINYAGLIDQSVVVSVTNFVPYPLVEISMAMRAVQTCSQSIPQNATSVSCGAVVVGV